MKSFAFPFRRFIQRALIVLSFFGMAAMGWGQYSVNFEGASETKTSYASGSVTLSGISWNMTDALIGTEAADYKNGLRSARMRGYSSSSMTMSANKANGLGSITFKYWRYGTDAQATWKVEYSTDNGLSWTQAGSNFTPATNNNEQTFTAASINISANVRIRIIHVSGGNTSTNRRFNIDDIILTDYSAPVTVPISNTPTVSSITTTSATLGATVFSNGGASLTARGTVWGTTAAPTGNALAENGTNVGIFSHTRTGLTANTLYYFRGYATNSAGTGYSGDGTFTTLHNSPTIGSGSNATTTTIDASWSAPSGGSAAFSYEIQVDDNNDFSSPTYSQNSISSATTSIIATGLASNTIYYYRVRANNAGGSSAWSNSSVGYSTSEASNPTLSATVLTAFGNVCLNETNSPNSFSINGSALSNADITISSLTGFTFSTTIDGIYSSSLTLAQAGGSYAQEIFVKFTPTTSSAFSGNIVVGGGGASNVNVAASGTGISGSIAVTTVIASSITTTTASTGGTAVSTTCGTITAKGVAYGTSANPTTPVTSDGIGTADYSSILTGLTPNTEYNYRAYATNSNSVTSYGSNLTFTTLHNAPTVGPGSGATISSIIANWTAPTGGGSATFTYEVAISTAADFSSTLATQSGISSATSTHQFTGLTGSTTYYFRVRTNNAGGSSAWSTVSGGYVTLSDAISLTALGTVATEDFNTLANSGASSTMPTGWFFTEGGSGTNNTYTSGTGSGTGGDTYSFGPAFNNERALGGLQSGSLTPTIGAKITNNTGAAINNLFISYTGETWRVGAASRIDRLDFQYSIDATSLSTGTWTDFDALDYANPGQAIGSGSLQHSYAISDVITSLAIANGATFWIRWTDFNASGADDGMGVDDFSIKPCGTVSAPTVSAQTFCAASAPTVDGLAATGSNILWYAASAGGSALATSTALTSGNYYASQTVSGCESSSRAAVVVTVNAAGTWIGGSSGNFNDSNNWCGGIPTSSATITNGSTVTLNTTSAISLTNLTIDAGGSLIIPSSGKLTISGALINNGTLKIESGGSLVQSGSTPNSGTGTYIAERYMTGSSANNQPNGRFWYMGVPMTGTTSTAVDAASTGNKLWSHSETSGNYAEITTNGDPFTQGAGYVFRGGSNATYSFSSNNIGNGEVIFNLTRTASSSKPGFNLLSNPYPSHLNFDALYNSTLVNQASPLLPTIWYRTATVGGVMLFDTYNSVYNVGTSLSGVAVSKMVAPFQSFWVRLNTGTSLNMTATNDMRFHDNQNFLTLTPALVRLNLSNGTFHDQAIVVLNEDLSNAYDYRDSDKEIPSATVHQIYSLEGTKKVVINGIADAIEKDTLQLGVQIPTAGTYSINCSELTFSDLVYLEDKITEAYIQLDNTSTYSFTSEAGTFNNRFVLHFAPVPALPGQTAATAIAMSTSNWPQCNNVSTEDQWHSFTAGTEAVSIAVNTTTSDITIELQDGTGNVVAQENAVNGIGNETLNFYGLTAGQTYKVGVRNTNSNEPAGTYGICVKTLKRGGCDYGAGPYSLCQYYKATWAGSTGVSYTFTFTGTSGPAQGQTFTRTQNSDICVLSTVTPLLPYGSTYDVTISNTYTLTDGAGNTEQITVPSNSGCQVVTIAQPQTTLSANSSCNNGPRFRGAVVSSMPWVCGANNWRWRFTEVNPLTLQAVGLPIELNRGAASNFLSLGTVNQLQNGKTYAVQTAPLFTYTASNYQWGPVQYMCIVGNTAMTLEGTDASQDVAQGQNKDAMQDASQVEAVVYVTEGNRLNIQLTNAESSTAKRADIYDVTGKLVKSVRLVEGMNTVAIDQASGIYMVRTMVGEKVETQRVFLR